MIRLVLVSLLSSISVLSVARVAQAGTVGSYSGCKSLGPNAAACTACLRGGQFYNFDRERKKWVCGATTHMKPSKPMTSKKPTKPTKPTSTKPSSVKKR